jgi:hypothetical protein
VNASAADGRGNAGALAEALQGLGVACAVEPRQGLAIITVDAGSAASLATLHRRQAILAMAKEHGFTHVAVELTADPAGAGAPVLRP